MPSQKDWRFRLVDIVDNARFAMSKTEGHSLQTFSNDRDALYVAVACLSMIGEASGHIPKAVQLEYADIPWDKMKAMRNVVVHDYDQLDANIIWDTLIYDLPPLVSAVEHMLNQA